jgi:hypothetical protein
VLALATLLATASLAPASAQSLPNRDHGQDRPSTSPSQAGEVPDDPDFTRDKPPAEKLKELRRRNDSFQDVKRPSGQIPVTDPPPARPALGDPGPAPR